MFDEDDSSLRRNGPLTRRAWIYSILLHVGLCVVIWGVSAIFNRPSEVIIPIDMTIVPPWVQQTDDPEPDPNPLPPPEPEVKPKPKPQPEPEPKVEKVEAVEKVVEKKKPINLRDKAKLVKTPPKPVDLRQRAQLVKTPITTRTGKATAHEKPLSPEEIARLLNQGYRYGAKNQLATSEEQRCVSLIQHVIKMEWNKENFRWYPGLKVIHVRLHFGSGGKIKQFQIIGSSGDGNVDRTAHNALSRIDSIRGLSASFLEQHQVIDVDMEPVQQN